MQRRQAASLIGQVIGHYKISHPIGTGGMGDVYLATDTRAGRKAALKLLPTRFAGDSVRLQRFQQEAHAVTALNHPNILTVYEIGEGGSTSYIASELIEGETLRQRLLRGRIPLDEAVEIALQVASALAAAHDAGIIHRDIKPENIMLRPDGYVKVLDFGIAKLAKEEFSTAMLTGEAPSLVATHLGSILGTVRYMSPEQTHGWQVDNSTDIWSLGAVLYEIVTGQAPFTGTTPDEVISAIFEVEPAPLTNYFGQAPAELGKIVSKALCKDRSERYHDAHDLLEALKFFRRELEVRSELERRSVAGLSWLRWKGARVALAVALLAVGLAVSFYWHRDQTADSSSEKSIAVLPFENLGKDEENAFFAGGLQEDILSDLAKIADLKVISRTSVMRYKPGKERNLREIAKALGVSHVLEGSVQRVGPRVRVNAQLIDARNDAHLWAEHYDRDLADVFAIQTEIAQQIANQLRVKLSAAEKAAIAEPPTADLVAYAYYAKANEMDIWDDWEGAEKSASRKVELLQKAIDRDPNFALAYCALANAQVDFFKATDDRRHLDSAGKAAEAAVRVGPDLGEAHLELARYYFMIGVYSRDYQPARAELAIVQRKLPNNSEALWLEAMIDRHQNRWNNAIANLQKASALDPRNAEVTYQLRQTYFEMRRYRESEQILTKEARSDAPVAPWIQIGSRPEDSKDF
ncbi:MAG: protein kinase [Chthoniobacterales bacterium]